MIFEFVISYGDDSRLGRTFIIVILYTIMLLECAECENIIYEPS